MITSKILIKLKELSRPDVKIIIKSTYKILYSIKLDSFENRNNNLVKYKDLINKINGIVSPIYL